MADPHRILIVASDEEAKRLAAELARAGIAAETRVVPDVAAADAALAGGSSARALASTRLHDSARLAAIVDSALDAIVVIDTAQRIVLFNRTAERMFGYVQAEVIGRSLDMLIPERFRAIHAGHVVAFAQSAVRTREMASWRSIVGLRRSGVEFPIEAAISQVGDGPEKQLTVAIRDITERVAAAAELRRREAYFRALIEHSSDIVAVTERDALVRYVSPAVTRVLGYPADEVVGRIGFSFVIEEDVAETARTYEAIGNSPGLSDPVRVRARHKDGTVRHMEFVANNLLDVPEIAGIVLSVRDVSERVRAEDALKKSEERLRQAQKMEAVGRLAGGVAHDFNNLLTVIVGYTELALRRLAPEVPIRRDIVEIHRAAERASSLTRSLLAFSRQQVLEPRAIDANRLIVDLERMLLRLIGEDIEIVTRLEAEGHVLVDRSQLEQVIVNLVVNARDAMPEGGTLTIGTEDVTLPVEGGPPRAIVRITVRDTGVGMSEDVRARAFEPFFTTKEPGKGTGLGLAMAYGIVRQSNGEITLESAPRAGAIFRIDLPRARSGAAEPAPAVSSDLPRGGSESILLVEDEETVRRLEREVLSRLGYWLVEARNGRDALLARASFEGRVDLLLADVVMPGMGGVELAKELTARDPGLRVLLTLGYVPNAELPVDRPGFFFLAKPFTPDSLARKVREVLDSPRPGAARAL